MDIDYIANVISILILILITSGIIYYLFVYDKKSETFETRHNKKVETFKEKIQILEEKVNNLIENEPLNIPNIDKERELFELYYKGVPDTYDLQNRLIKGVEPDAHKAIHYLNIIINSPYGNEKDILNLAKIYHYGMHKFERDLDKAEQIYNELKFENITNDTRALIKEALMDIHKIRVYAWLNLPLERPEQTNFNQRTIIHLPDNNIIGHDNIEGQLVINELRPGRRQRPLAPPIEIKVDQKGYNDPQNTHNPQVLSTIRHSLAKLKMNTPIIRSQGQTTTDIKTYIYTLPDSDKKEDALRSLRAIENNPEKLSSTDMNELDALTLVWNRVNDSTKFNKEIIDNLKETLFDELASMQEFGATICSTGRFTHIIDTLNGVDEEVSIKPTYAINEEMMTKSAKIRENLLSELPEIEREQVEKGTSSKQDEFDNNLKKTIVDKLKEDYVATGILSESKFNAEIGKWIDHI